MTFYNRQGKEISIEEWQKLHKNDSYRFVGQTEEKQHYISTIWMGLNQNHSMVRPPLIFETAIFSKTDTDYVEIFGRWETEADALAGHETAVNLFKNGQGWRLNP